MKKFYQLLAALVVLFLITRLETKAQDTIHVQCFTYGSTLDSTFVFPSDTVRFQKILMNYKLRCPYNAPCGQWDYLTYTFLYKPTGRYDSVEHVVPGFMVNGASPDSFPFMNSPSYSHHAGFEKYINHRNTLSFDSAKISGNTISMNHPFNAAVPVCRSQYLWKALELSEAGLTAGNITGLRLNVMTAGSTLRHLVIRAKLSGLDSITTGGYETTGFTTLYDRRTSFSSTGWTNFEFTNFLNWDGISNIVFDISFSNDNDGTPSLVSGSTKGFPSGITIQSEDRNLFFERMDHVEVPAQAFDQVDSVITICFWSYGNPLYQPQNQSIFEAFDSSGQRVLNCHLPWSDSRIYWDAGNSGTGSYDRINRPAASNEYEGNWVHWSFVKNVRTGKMIIYKNGSLFVQGINKTKLMTGIKKFYLGSMANGTNSYAGYIDDFAVFNTELSTNTIKQWLYKKIDSTHPNYSNLLLYYSFDQASISTASDSAPGSHNGSLFGVPASGLYASTDVFKNLINTTARPDVILEQGVYSFTIDSSLVADSTVNTPVEIIYYDTSIYPATALDTQLVYPAYYNNYSYNSSGMAIDSSLVMPDSTLYLTNGHFWDPPYEVNDRYELGRYITPYGNGLNLGNGFTWIYDVSDYRTLLHDTVHLNAGNWQEMLDLSFDMIKGIPPRDPISVENIYPGGDFVYGTTYDPIENHFPPKKVYIEPAAMNTRIKYRSTGHGEDGNNCDEFCPKSQYIFVDGTQRFSQLVWKDDCALNPLYPQGGTWVYQRANWCPGDDVPTFDFELTPYVTPGDSTIINVNFQPYTMVISSSGNSTPHCVVETQLIKYGAPNFTLDAAMYEIKSPTNLQIYQRHNPICNNPLVTIQNTGSTNLTSLDITYGQVGGIQSTYHWTGNLAFLEKQDVQLGSVIWNVPGTEFIATVSNPNGGTDQYSVNNSMTSAFTVPAVLDNSLIFQLRTNNESYQNQYTLTDDLGNVILSRSGLIDNHTYNDVVNLPNGCYTFRLTDSGEDGLNWWANPGGGSGYMNILRASDSTVVRSFGSDFGAEIYFQFTTGYVLGTVDQSDANSVRIFPNPSSGKINFDFNLANRQDAIIEIFSLAGNKIFEQKELNIINRNFTADLSAEPAGIYIVSVRTNDKVYHAKVVLSK